MRTPHSPTTAARVLGRIVRAAVSLLVLAGAVVGLPLLLAWVTPIIWTSAHDDLAHLLTRQDTGSAFLVLLLVVGWFGWAQFAFCAVRELVAQLRGSSWQVPRGLGASQRAAALLIGSILVLLPTSSALASPAHAALHAGAVQVPGQSQAPRAAGSDVASVPASSTPQGSTYTVREMRPAESLWSIAERQLGDGERWRDIAALNAGCTMADGQVFKANSFLQPGWQLAMPDSPAASGGPRTQLDDSGTSAVDAAEVREHVVTVHSGDYLSKIAEEELGDGAAWPKLFKASQGKPQPDGLPAISDPDVIYAGQQITVPAKDTSPPQEGDHTGHERQTPPATQTPGNHKEGTQPPAPSRSAAPAPHTSTPSTPTSHPASRPRHEQSAPPEAASSPTPRPSASAPASAAPSHAAKPSSPAGSSPAATPAETPVSSPASGPLGLRTVLGAGALLAAAVTGALALRRALQRRRRKPGEKIAISAQTSPAEAQLTAAAEPGGAVRLDVALRTLAHQFAEADAVSDLPQLRAARIGARSLQVLPEDLSLPPQPPFVSGKDGWWSLPADAVLLDEEAAREVPAPYPGLVTIGSTEDGDLLLLNLAQLPALLLDGNPVHITEVCTSLALELGMSPWAGEVEVITIGFGEDLPQLLPTARIAHMRQATHALRDLSERLLEAHQMPETSHQPYVLLCASCLDPDTVWEFAEACDKAFTVPVTLVAPASTAAAHFPDAEVLNASLSEPQHLHYTGTEITLQRLEHGAYLQIAAVLKVSGQPAHPAEGPWQNVPGERGSRPHESLAEAPASTSDPAPLPWLAEAEETETDRGVFPALLAASTDPGGLRLLATAATPEDDENPLEQESGPEPIAVPAPAAADENQNPVGDFDPHLPPQEARHDLAEVEHDAHDLHAPEIRVLGLVEVSGVAATGHGPKMAQLASLLYFRPGRSADTLCADMDPISPWSASTLNARIQGLRRCLGNDPSGNPYVPRRTSGDDPYRLASGVRCDWNRFLHLVEQALPQGATGLPDLERALTLVRGKPFGGKPLPWAEPYQQEMITRIIDVAHTVAAYRTPAGPHQDLSAARQAVVTGLDADDTAELLYRDLMRIEHAAGNRSGLHTAITRIQQINHALDCSPELETQQLAASLLNGKEPPGSTNSLRP
ncbi:hypothetical protein ACH41H_43925 [Streptomyces sp. NPDC020800]|uniref:hypothetical protein n=1 Tax=Streptomyces sp. NPDC020800 TaxID=3365092 RepID=UPI0037B9BEB5